MPESEGKLLFAENLNLREGKLCSSEKPSWTDVDLLTMNIEQVSRILVGLVPILVSEVIRE